MKITKNLAKFFLNLHDNFSKFLKVFKNILKFLNNLKIKNFNILIYAGAFSKQVTRRSVFHNTGRVRPVGEENEWCLYTRVRGERSGAWGYT